MEITSIKLKSKRNSNIFLAITDVGEFDLHSDIIVKNSIKVGNIKDDVFYLAVEESNKIIALNLATKYLGNRLKTERQIKDYLYKYEYNKSVVDYVVEKLKEYKIIDDKVYAETYIRTNPNFSKNKVKQKLLGFGVKVENMESELEEIDDFESCFRQAEKFVKNKVLDKPTIDKLIRRLLGQGYNWDSIKFVLNKLKCEIEYE